MLHNLLYLIQEIISRTERRHKITSGLFKSWSEKSLAYAINPLMNRLPPASVHLVLWSSSSQVTTPVTGRPPARQANPFSPSQIDTARAIRPCSQPANVGRPIQIVSIRRILLPPARAS